MNKKLLISQKRKERDIIKLISSGYSITRNQEKPSELTVIFNGPKETLYENGIWNILIHLPENYPYKSPSIGFLNKIYHPNIDFNSGSICLDVINQTWSPMYELVNIFEIFLPQLLVYPNPSDPLNIDAANLLNSNKVRYEEFVKLQVKKHSLGSSEEKFCKMEDELSRKSTKSEVDNFSCSLSHESELSVLSDTSDIFLEEEIF